MPLAGERPLVVIIGPTAVGKTEAAIQAAQALDGEILSADSRQIYRYMDIGTAKPTPAQQVMVPHHLIDVVAPDVAFNVRDFQEQATALIAEIQARGRLPMLVGGTGQYISATIEGWQFPSVAPNKELRAELEAYAEVHGWEALLERLRQHDPVTAADIDGRNIRRVVRALEVCIESGRPYSELRQKKPPGYTIKTIGLTLEDRAKLYERADLRIERMIEAGFIAEVQALIERGYSWELPAMSALGYLQIGYYLRGEMSLDDALQKLRRATRTFIRRQYTWFRKYNADAVWLESDVDVADNLIAHLTVE